MSEETTTDQVALITGAASGLGRAVATALAARGTKVMVADIDEEGGRAVAEELDATLRRLRRRATSTPTSPRSRRPR